MKKIELTQEMIDDLYKFGDIEFSNKWEISRMTVIRKRKELGISSFTPQHNTKPHIFKGDSEYKWCPKCKEYVIVSGFNLCKTRYDGLRGICRFHEKEEKSKYEKSDVGKQTKNKWKKTENGISYLRNTWRKKIAIRKQILGIWGIQEEIKTFDLFEHRCAYCRVPLEFNSLEFDHLIPISKGGMTTIGNMLPCCTQCNHGVGGKFNKDIVEWTQERFGDIISKAILRDIKQKLLKL